MDLDVSKFIFGVVVYWYMDVIFFMFVFDYVYKKFLDYFMFGIEVCYDMVIYFVNFGNWKYVEGYVNDIM